MLEFKKLTLDDINVLRPYFRNNISRICNNTIGSVFMWRDYFAMEYAVYNDTVILKAQARHDDIENVYSLPLGKDFNGAIGKTIEHCHFYNIPAAFYAVTDEDLSVLKGIFSGYELYTKEDWSDYLYRAGDLVNLEGRKYSSKRNHINYFRKAYADYSFEVISRDNITQVREFYAGLDPEAEPVSCTAVEDRKITLEVLDNFDIYGLPGGLLRVGGSVIAFSVGEVKNDILFVHVEKADIKYRGAYQTINNEFAKHFIKDGIRFINREEDDGDMGLRFSKKSYHPHEIIDKYILIVV